MNSYIVLIKFDMKTNGLIYSKVKMKCFIKKKAKNETEKLIKMEVQHGHNFQDPRGGLNMWGLGYSLIMQDSPFVINWSHYDQPST